MTKVDRKNPSVVLLLEEDEGFNKNLAVLLLGEDKGLQTRLEGGVERLGWRGRGWCGAASLSGAGKT